MVQLNFMDFNLVEGELEKERGMRISAARRQGLLRLAREIAKMLAETGCAVGSSASVYRKLAA